VSGPHQPKVIGRPNRICFDESESTTVRTSASAQHGRREEGPPIAARVDGDKLLGFKDHGGLAGRPAATAGRNDSDHDGRCPR